MAVKTTHVRRLTGMVPAEDYQALEAHAKANERSVSAELRLAVRAYLAQQEREAA